MPCPEKQEREIKAVVFDLDDTLVSSRFYAEMMRPRVIAKLRSMGFPENILDPNVPAAVTVLRARTMLCESDGCTMVAEYDSKINALLLGIELDNLAKVAPIEGCPRMIAELEALGLGIGVLTRSSRGYAVQVLRKVGLERMQKRLLCRDDHPLDQAKPHPMAMQRIAADLGQDVTECILVGDHLLDLQCAREARAPFVGVLTGSMDESAWRQADCNLIVRDVTHLTSLLRHEEKEGALRVWLKHKP